MSNSYPVSESVLPYGPSQYQVSTSGRWRVSTWTETPVYQQLLTWLLLFPLLTMAAKGSLSFFSPPRSDYDFQNGYLSNTAQGIRIPIVMNLLTLAVFITIGHKRVWRVLMNNRLILASLVFGALSAIWSESPGVTLRMTAELTLSTCFTCYLTDRLSTERLMSVLMFVGLVAVAMSTFMVIFMPAYGVSQGYAHGAWRGICNHKNAFGVGMAFLMTPAFFTRHRPLIRWSYGSLMFLMVVLSQSRGAWFETAGVLAFVVWLRLYQRFRSYEALLLAAGTLMITTVVVIVGITYFEPIMAFIGKDPSMSGRTGIYGIVWHSITKHLLLGYGLGAFWMGLNHESINIGLQLHWMAIGYAENGVLDLALQVGILGTSIVLAMIFKALRQAAKLIRSPFYNPRIGWFATLLALEIFINIESGWLLAAHALDWALTLVACIGLNNEMRQANALKQS